MSHKIKTVKGIKLYVYQKSFRVMDGIIGSEIVFPPTIDDDTIESLVTAIYDVVEKNAIETALKKVEKHLHNQISKALIDSLEV